MGKKQRNCSSTNKRMNRSFKYMWLDNVFFVYLFIYWLSLFLLLVFPFHLGHIFSLQLSCVSDDNLINFERIIVFNNFLSLNKLYTLYIFLKIINLKKCLSVESNYYLLLVYRLLRWLIESLLIAIHMNIIMFRPILIQNNETRRVTAYNNRCLHMYSFIQYMFFIIIFFETRNIWTFDFLFILCFREFNTHINVFVWNFIGISHFYSFTYIHVNVNIRYFISFHSVWIFGFVWKQQLKTI